jgi:Helix-turn-helix domain
MSARDDSNTRADTAPLQIRSHRRAHWSWFDNAIMRDHAKALGPVGVMVYMALVTYANHETQRCWPSIVRLSHELGLARLTIRRALQRLVARKLVTLDERQGYAFVITLLEVPHTSVSQPQAQEAEGCVPGKQGGGADGSGGVHQMHTNQIF